MQSLQDALSDAIAVYLRARALGSESTDTFRGSADYAELLPKAQGIANELVVQAVASGMPLTRFTVKGTPIGGGNTAGLVATAMLHVPFVLKLDENAKKLAEEGLLMQRLRGDTALPEIFRESFPRVYAVRTEAPYAYLMEIFPRDDGFFSLEERLYPVPPAEAPSSSQVYRFVHVTLDLLFLGYRSTIDRRRQPNLFADYVDRIRERLSATAKIDDRFASRSVRINRNTVLTPWEETLRAIERHAAQIQAITPRFITHVHGDPNPGNLILRQTDAGVEVKQIDPKDWGTGDYLFDVTKLTHFFEGTGPAEKLTYGASKVERFAVENGQTILERELVNVPWTNGAVEAIRERTKAFAEEYQDTYWELRYKLGMASNLLGLPLGRLAGKPDAAAILYGEGLKWLERFRDGLEEL
jgi:Phosphotransferase enzyme family